jgi:magnesium-transporting ATPase (P-type)
MYRIEKKARAIEDHNAVDGGELSYYKGDIINITSQQSPRGNGYWEGELNGRAGAFLVRDTEIMVVDPNAPTNKDMIGPAHVQVSVQPKYEDKEDFDKDHTLWKVIFIFGAITFILMLISLAVPWYYVANQDIRVFQFQGIRTYNLSEINPRLVGTSKSEPYKSYLQLNMPRMNTMNTISAFFGSLALVVQFFLLGMIGFRVKGFWPKIIWGLPFVALAILVFQIIATISYFLNFGTNYGIEVDRKDTVIPNKFVGDTWGPTAGWYLAVISLIPAFFQFLLPFDDSSRTYE